MNLKKIITLIMSVMLGISLIGCSSKVDPNEVVMTVNGRDVNAGYYEKMLGLYKQSIESMYGASIWEQEVEKGVKYKDKFKEIILQQIIDTEAVYAKAEELKLLPNDEEIEKSYKELKTSLEASEEGMKNLKSMGIDDAFLKEQTKKDLAWQNYKTNFDKVNTVSDEEIQKYYDDNKESFYKDEAKASHILISTLDENDKPLSDEKKAEAKKKAEDILKRAKAGEEFAELATEYSEDPGTASKGGDLGYFGKGKMVKEFEDATFALKVGEISDIVESEYGYHIIKLTDRIDEQTTVEDNKDSIKQTLLYEKYTNNIKKLSEEAKVEKKQDVIDSIKFL